MISETYFEIGFARRVFADFALALVSFSIFRLSGLGLPPDVKPPSLPHGTGLGLQSTIVFHPIEQPLDARHLVVALVPRPPGSNPSRGGEAGQFNA